MGKSSNFTSKKDEAQSLSKELRVLGPVPTEALVTFKARLEEVNKKIEA
jgi:hypothetical protein